MLTWLFSPRGVLRFRVSSASSFKFPNLFCLMNLMCLMSLKIYIITLGSHKRNVHLKIKNTTRVSKMLE